MTSHTLPMLLSIPLELRLKIYESILNKRLPHHPKYFLCILSVCHQIRREILPVVFQDSRYFGNLEKFTKWTEDGEPYLLKMVQDLSIHIFDPSLSALAECKYPSNERDISHVEASTGTWWERKYQQQLEASKPQSVENLSQTIEGKQLSPKEATHKDSRGAIISTWNALKSVNKVKKLWILLKGQSHGASAQQTFLVEQILM